MSMKYDGPLATIANLTDFGVHQAEAWCRRCDHRAMLPLDRFPPARPFVSLKPRLICTGCGSRDIELSPDWRGHRPSGRI
jgi:Zn finger protein HypA/HybF involved in hydrogenase expression